MSEVFHPHLLRLFPEHRSREQRTRQLTLDDLIDDYRSTHTLKASEFDWLLMAYRFEYFFQDFFRQFSKRPPKPNGLIDLWRLAFAALLTRDQSLEQLTHGLVEESKKLFGPFTAAPTNAFCREVLRQKAVLLKKDPTLLLGPTLARRWEGSEVALRMAHALKHRPKSGFSFLKNDGTFVCGSLDDFQREASAQALARGSFEWMQKAFEKKLATLREKKSLRVLDMCSAPGGKLFAFLVLAQKYSLPIEIAVANDAKFKRLERLKENIGRWNLPVKIKTQLCDWSKIPDGLAAFDIVLADLPCTGLGTLSSRPDLLLEDWTHIDAKLLALQTHLLDVARKLLAPQGSLWVSICSSDPEECAHISQNLDAAPFFQSRVNDENHEEISGWL